MALTTTSGFQAAAGAPAYGELALVELQLRSGTARYTNWPLPVDVMGQTWQGVGNLGTIGQLHESEDGGSEQLKIGLSGADIGTRALALGDPTDYQDRPVRVWIALLDANTLQISGSPVLRFAGVMDQMKIDRDGNLAWIEMVCRTACYDVRTNPSSLRCNNAQHQARHPGELGFEFLTGLIGNPAVWISKFAQSGLNIRNTVRNGK